MSLIGIVGTAIAPWLGEWAIVGIAGKLTEGAIRRFKPDEMALLLKQSIAAAEAAQPKTGALFDRCHHDGYKGVTNFLEQFFLSGEVLKELQKPLQDKGKPDLDILIAAFKQSAQQHPEAKQYLLNSLSLWMETFVDSYFEQIKGICFQVAKAQYLKQLARRVDDVKFVGIAVPGEEVEKQEVLAQIFVMPDVREEKIRNSRQLLTPWEEDLHEVRRQMMEGDMFDGNHLVGKNFKLNANRSARVQKLTKQSLLLKEQKEWETRDRSAPRIPAQKVINLAQKKAVVLGAPGSGKTMLASYFALMLCETPQSDPTQIGLAKDADYLPVVVRIRDWILQPKMGLLEYLRSNAEVSLACKELPTGFFEHWLDRGKALILLDGLDEVVDEAQRRKVAEQIETFLHQYQDNPAVITSRPAGYRWDFFNLDEFPHYTLESFDDKQVATFIDHWYDSRLKDDKAQADRRKADLQKAFARNERIRLLAKNPLLLTIITLIHRYQAELPRQRYKLYEKAVETLLTSWDSGKEIKLYSQVLLFLKSDDLLYILKKLAYWIHTQGSTSDNEGGTLIDKDELIRWLRKEIQTLKKCEAHEAKGEAERFIDFIQRRTGLLNEQGRDRYAFVHKTFQEYLTAEEIFDRADVEDDTEIILAHFRQHLHDQHWREVLLLLVSKLKGKKAQKAIQAVLDAGSAYEKWLHRDLLFAGWCLTEDPPELTVVAADWVGGILDRLIDLGSKNTDLTLGKTQSSCEIAREASQIICCFGETTLELNAWNKLQLNAVHIDCIQILEFQIALGQEAEAINALLYLLSNEDWDVRLRSVLLLGQIGNANSAVINGLLSLLRDRDSSLKPCVAKVLGDLGVADSAVINGLFSLLNDEDFDVNYSAAESLHRLGNIDLEVMNVLLQMEEHNISQAEEYQTSLPSSIMETIETEEELSLIINNHLILLNSEEYNVRINSIYSLRELGNSSIEVVIGLVSRLNDEDWRVCHSAKGALIQLAKTSDTICPKVVQWLEQNPNDDGIGNAIDCLWSIVLE